MKEENFIYKLIDVYHPNPDVMGFLHIGDTFELKFNVTGSVLITNHTTEVIKLLSLSTAHSLLSSIKSQRVKEDYEEIQDW